MFLTRLKIIVLSALIFGGFCWFLLYRVDGFVKNEALGVLSTQLRANGELSFSKVGVEGERVVHDTSAIEALRKQPNLKDLWLSRSDELSQELSKPTTAIRDELERKVYLTKNTESSLTKIGSTNDQNARISVPILASQECVSCHSTLRVGDVAGSVNARFLLKDSVMGIFETMQPEIIALVLVAALVMMFVMLFSIRSFTELVFSMRGVIRGAIEGNFSARVKDSGLGIFGDTSKLANRMLETLDSTISSIDAKIASIFTYKKSYYSKNPLVRIKELIDEITNLFLFKNSIETAKQNREVYRGLQNIISRYIKYRYLIFVEIIGGEVVSGYKIEGDTETKITGADVKQIQNRLEAPNPNVLFDDNKGCLFISTSAETLSVIDICVNIAPNITLYYAIVMHSKKELLEKEGLASRIYNYIREATPIIKNIVLLKNIEESSYTDPLTKAYNRLYLEKYAPIVEARLPNRVSFGILMLDIDHFKKINDTYGHAMGDAGIVLLVETIRKVIRTSDKLFRYGGEEFVVILDSCEPSEAQKIAEKIRTAFQVAKKCSLGELDFHKSVSIGFSAMPHYAKNVWDCINQADIALYEAKEGGRNRVVRYLPTMKGKDAGAAKQSAEEAPSTTNIPNIDVAADDDEAAFLESLKLNDR